MYQDNNKTRNRYMVEKTLRLLQRHSKTNEFTTALLVLVAHPSCISLYIVLWGASKSNFREIFLIKKNNRPDIHCKD